MEIDDDLLEFKFIPGFRASSLLLYIEKEQQIYKFRYQKEDVKYYYCYEKNCKVSVAVESLNNTIYCRKSGKQKIHHHGSQCELINKLGVINSIKEEVKLAKRPNIRNIYDEQCKKFKDASQTIQYGKIRRTLQYIQQKSCPDSPKTYAEIINIFKNDDVMKQFGMSRSESEKRFYFGTVITDNFAYTLFVSPTIVYTVPSLSTSEPRNYIFDERSNAAPVSKEFKQLLVIHITHAEHAFPFAYILMSKKSEEAYTHMMQYLKSFVFDLKPQTIITDYSKKSLRNAVIKTYPTVKLLGCWFHYTKELRRNVLKIPEFQRFLNTNSHAKEIFNKFLCLPFLKPSDITAAFKILKEDALNAVHKDMKIITETLENYFEPFIEYFESYWIEREKPTNFSVYKQPIRMSVSAESFHRQLNLKLPKHGNFFKFLDLLCDIDAAKSSDYTKSISGYTSKLSYKKCSYTKRNEFLERQYQLFENNKITLITFLDQLSKIKNCMVEENFINTQIDSNDNESDEYEDEEERTLRENTETEQHSLSCVVSTENERQLLSDPCKHLKVCESCYQHIKDNALKQCSNCAVP